MEHKISSRIAKELTILKKAIDKKEIDGIQYELINENTRHLKLLIEGPSDTPYANGVFEFRIFYHQEYPVEPPKVKLHTQIYHPNINHLGDVCLNILKSEWSPIIQIKTLAMSLRGLLETPNLEDPLNINVTNHFKENPVEAANVAKQWTEIHAMKKK